MGRFSLLLLALAACGDNFTPSQTGSQPAPDPSGAITQPGATARLVPTVCMAQRWTPQLAADATMQLAVARHGAGAAVLAVPTTGGSLGGFAVDEQMTMATKASKVVTDATYTQASVASIDGQLVAGGIDPADGAARISLLSTDVRTSTEILKAPGAVLAQPAAVLSTDGAHVALIGDASGVTAWHFDRQTWQPVTSMQVATTDTPIGITAATNGDAMYVGWSTSSECFMARLPGFATPVLSSNGAPCPEPRMATDATGTTAVLLFQADDGIRINHVVNTKMAGDSQVLRARAHAPRVIFDGERFWASYINGHGDLSVGFFDSYNHLVTTDLVGLSPTEKGYELAMLGDAPWIIAIDPASGYSAHQLCIASE